MSQNPSGELPPEPEPPLARALPPPPFAEHAPAAVPNYAPAPEQLLGQAWPPPPFAQHAPAPAASLPYSLPSTLVSRTRPGLVTALGWTSAIVACLGVIASLATIALAALLFVAGKEADRAIASAPNTPLAPPSFLVQVDTSRPRVLPVGPDGLPDPQRRLAVNAIYSLRALRPPRMEQLDAILARAGKRILALEAVAPLGVEQVRSAVLDHGEMFAVNRRVAPPEYFKTSAGRLELYDDRAVFFPEDGSPPVRSTTASAAMPRPLTPEQVQAVVKQVQEAQGGSKLTPAQVSGLSAVLSLPNQKLAQVSSGLNGEPRSVTTYPGGEATIKFAGGELHLGRQGQILPGPPPPPGSGPPSAANVTALALSETAAVAALGLAVVLFVAAVATLRRTGRRTATGRKLHAVWALLKLPVAAGGGLALCWMLNTFTEAVGAAPANAIFAGSGTARLLSWADLAYGWAVAAAVLGGLYPLIVLVLLRTRTVREYYNPTDL
jgi:hypothetical protein